MDKVASPSHFSPDHYIGNFNGKDFEDAIKRATEWSQRTGMTLVSYYEQIAFGKSILVSYKKENKDEPIEGRI